MQKFGLSQSVKRFEDDRFITGAGRFVDDIAPVDALHAHFFRATVAHAKVTSLDISEALVSEGVAAVYTAADFAGKLHNAMSANLVTNKDGTKGADPVRPILASDRVCFLGETLAVVVADTKENAMAASEMIWAEFEDLPVTLQNIPGGETIHAEAPENLAFDWAFGDAAKTDAAFNAAAHHITLPVQNNRVFCNAMEPRACYAEFDGTRLHLCFGGQGVWGLKAQLAQKMALDTGDVHVTTQDVGGGFGTKAFAYPEYFAVAFAARKLGKGVRWYSDRSEAMLSDNSARDLQSIAEGAFDADHRLIGLRIHTISNLGAYNSQNGQNIQSELALKVLPGPYDVQAAYFSVQGVYTNTTPVDAYRGAGRPEAIYVLERLMDHAARQMDMDPAKLREINFIPRDAFPYRAVSGELYDVGDFQTVLERAKVEADLAGFAARKAASAATGKYRGLGLCYYIEAILGQATEISKIDFTDDGFVDIFVGTQSNGQGHETVYRQALHERLGVHLEQIRIIQGDSDLIAKGGGTGGSRSVTMQGNSIIATAQIVIEKFRPLAEDTLEVSAGDLVFENAAFKVVGTDRKVELASLVETAREQARGDLLSTEHDYALPARSYPNGAHYCEVEIDAATGHTQVVKYTVVDDFGLLINPMLAQGQVHGGVVQGIGQAINEHVIYDEHGQLLSGSFMDYGMPRAGDVPDVVFHTELLPSTANEIGMKGCGEAGTVGALAAVMNAVQDAVWDKGVRQVDMPVTPLRMWNWLQSTQ